MNPSETSTFQKNMDWTSESVADLDSCEGSEPSDVDEQVEETSVRTSTPRTTTTPKPTAAAIVTAPPVATRTPERGGNPHPRAQQRKPIPYSDSNKVKERTYTSTEVEEMRRSIMAEAATSSTTKKRVGMTHIGQGWAEHSNWREDLLVLNFGRFNCKPNVWEDEKTVPPQLRAAATILQGQLTDAITNGILGQGVPVTLSSKYEEDLLWVIDQATAALPDNITLEKFETERCGVRWRTELKSKTINTARGGRGWAKNGRGARSARPSQ